MGDGCRECSRNTRYSGFDHTRCSREKFEIDLGRKQERQTKTMVGGRRNVVAGNSSTIDEAAYACAHDSRTSLPPGPPCPSAGLRAPVPPIQSLVSAPRPPHRRQETKHSVLKTGLNILQAKKKYTYIWQCVSRPLRWILLHGKSNRLHHSIVLLRTPVNSYSQQCLPLMRVRPMYQLQDEQDSSGVAAWIL